jgi:hypothetical protein
MSVALAPTILALMSVALAPTILEEARTWTRASFLPLLASLVYDL